MRPIVCFTSDFGTDDAWVGVCHAVMYSACPELRVVDLSHQVPPFDLRKGAVVAAAGAWQLPDVVHLVVVDPGVGGPRRDVCLTTAGGAVLIGPDNGVLLPAAWRTGDVAEAYRIEAPRGGEPDPFPTFHARDVLAPAAAAVACGAAPSDLGPRIATDDLAPAPFARPRIEAGAVVAEVLDADRFGSLRLGVTESELERLGLDGQDVEMSFGHLVIRAPRRPSYADVPEGEPVALVDSSGWLTLSLRQDSAVERYGIEVGTQVRLRPRERVIPAR